jgi:protein-S-isoprenylcysteine O-methyltransferase Ste14
MYVSVTTMLAGWALSFHSGALALYASVVALAFHLRVVFGEEPVLARTFGAQWEDYRSRVPRWLL